MKKVIKKEFRCTACKYRDECPAYDTGVLFPCPHFKEENICTFCLNARVDHELCDNNDLSYRTIGSSERDYQLMIRSGDRKPVALISEYHTCFGWKMTSFYYPKFCPECGRVLTTDYPEWRK